jgi:YidC/Oxa1 family membrane protein insertase
VTGTIFYTLFVWPVRFILESLFVLFNRIFDAPGPSVVFLSVVVNTLTLPIYIIADRWQKEERELQKRMKKKLAVIKSAFRGDERQMIINAYYRQTGYSPVFILKASVGLLLQIPFFIAAYQFLSHTSLLSGASFLFLRDLNAPDNLIRLGKLSFNVMPVLMTALNFVSSLIYAKDLGKRELVQLSAMALIFLVLLYNSPAGLVLYWTVNNLYSLAKNAASAALKKPGKVLQIVFGIFAVVFLVLIWSGKAKVERYGPLFSAFAAALIILPFVWKWLLKAMERRGETENLYYLSMLTLFFLLGMLSPLQVIAASVPDFEHPWGFIGRTFAQGFAFLVLIPLFVRALAPKDVRKILTASFPVLAILCLICYFVLSKSYGVMDRNFKLDDTGRLIHAFPLWVNFAAVIISLAVPALFVFFGKEKFLAQLLGASSAALAVLSVIELFSIAGQTAELEKLKAYDAGISGKTEIVFPLSRTETNTFIVFFDRAQGSAMTDALEYMPSLKKELDGFVFYPNTLSFGSCTVTGVPAMLGGYNYTPSAVNDRKDELLVDKVNEALTLLPRLFAEADHRVSITDPVIANMQSVPDISIFRDMKNVSAKSLSGKMAARFREEFPDNGEHEINTFDFDILFRYGIFRAALPALRYGIHYKGQWWREAAYNSYGRAVAEFSGLYYLPELCGIDEGKGTLNIFMSAVTHESGAYGAALFPQPGSVQFTDEETAKFGSEDNAEYMYTFLSAMKQFVKWLEYLKANGIYDNTRIIVVSDHGGHYHSGSTQFDGMENHNPLLMIKDPGSRGSLEISGEFMTHADTPALAAKSLPAASVAAEELHRNADTAKRGRLFAVSEVSSQPLRHGPYRFNLDGIRELRGREVLERDSWGDWERDD